MTLLQLVEDRPTPPQVYNWPIYLLAAVASCASCMIGYDSAFIGQTIELDSFTNEFHFNEWSEAKVQLVSENIVSLYQAGAFFGALFAYPIGYYWGQKWGLLATGNIFTIGSGLMLGANGQRGLGIMYAGRVLAGIGVGSGSNLTPIYISELSPPAIRGRLVGVYEMGWQIGGLVGFWINYGVSETMAASHTQWLIPFAVQLIPSGILLIGSAFIRESPRWLFFRGRRQEAIENLCWVRQLPADELYMVGEIAGIDQALEEQKAAIGIGFWKPFQAAWESSRIKWRLFLGFMLFFWQNGSGINAINYYSPSIFGSIGVRGSTNQLLTGIFGVVKMAVTIIWIVWLIDQLGRRKLMIGGAISGSICLWVIGTYIYIVDPESKPDMKLNGSGVMAIFFFYLYTACYTPTWNGTPWVMNSEMFDPNMRALAQAVASASNWLWNFLISRFTRQMLSSMGYGVYFFFASLMVLAAFFVFFLVPETKGIPLEVMDRLFETKPVWCAHGRVMTELHENEDAFRQNIQESKLADDKDDEEFIERA